MNIALTRQGQNPALPPASCAPLLELATWEVCEIMLGTQLGQGMDMEPPRTPDLTALIGLAGKVCGVVSLRCEAVSARRMAGKMLGTEPAEGSELDKSSRDAIGEICNMLAGNFKAKLAGLVDGCVLSVPTVITGSDDQLHLLTDGSRTEVTFDFEGAPIWVALDLHS